MRYRFIIAALAAVTVVSSNAAPTSPYVGQEKREIKSLSPQEMNDLLTGKGMGFAKAAELNGYPGPSHVIELADQLNLTPEQRKQTEALFQDMKGRAVDAGKELIAAERALNDIFVSKTVSASSLKQAVDRVASREAKVRLVHLETHLSQVKILTTEQVTMYNTLRGYTGAAPQPHRHH